MSTSSSATPALAVFGVLTVQAVFAGYQILGKIVVSSGINPISFALMREVAASIVFLLAASTLLPGSAWPKREHYGRFLLCGASMFGNVFLNLMALTITSASTVTLLQPTQPVFAAVFASLLGHERMTPLKVVGVVVGCLGSFVMTVAAQRGEVSGPDFGCLAVLVQCASGANYMVQQWPLVHAGYSPLIVSSCSYAVATVLTIIVGAFYFGCMPHEDLAKVQWWESSSRFVAALLYVVLLTTVYNYVVLAWATGKLGAPLVTLCMLLQGVFGCLAEWFFFQHPLTAKQGAGAVLIAIGLCVVVWARQRASAAPGIPEQATAAAPLDFEHLPCADGDDK